MSRTHRRRIRERVESGKVAAAAALREAQISNCQTDADFYDDNTTGEDLARCEICGTEDDGCGMVHQQCDICGMPGCSSCLLAGDDMYPLICQDCA